MSDGRDENGYYTSCDSCGDKFYGYDDLCLNIVDDKAYCPECSIDSGYFHKGKNGRTYANNNLWYVAHSFSSMYDGPHRYATSIKVFEKEFEILSVKHRGADPMFMNIGFGLTGHIDDAHYRVDVRHREKGFEAQYYAFIFKPDLDELERMLEYGIKEVKD